jgi:hypothetical protein
VVKTLSSDQQEETAFETLRTSLLAFSEDAEAAYEQLPVEEFGNNVVGCWDTDSGKYRYFAVPFMTFANLHSVYHWCAFAALFSHVAQHFGIPMDNYVDDFNVIERAATCPASY